VSNWNGAVRLSRLTHDVWMVDSLQDLRLLVQALLVNRHLAGGTLGVDLLDGPGRRIQLPRSRIHLINSTNRLFPYRRDNEPMQC